MLSRESKQLTQNCGLAPASEVPQKKVTTAILNGAVSKSFVDLAPGNCVKVTPQASVRTMNTNESIPSPKYS